MTKEQFVKILKEKGIKYSLTETGVEITKENGNVWLDNLEELSEGTVFNNSEDVYLYNLNNKKIIYKNHEYLVKVVDGWTMLITSEKNLNEFKIYKGFFFRGGDLKVPCYIAEKDGYFAHGSSMKKAIEDCNFKYLQEHLDKDDLIKQIKEKGSVTIQDYRLLTGACQLGVNKFLSEKGITGDSLTIDQVIELTKGAYGGNVFREYFE
jgi:hypothetical protein